jgi:hypothetical protein
MSPLSRPAGVEFLAQDGMFQSRIDTCCSQTLIVRLAHLPEMSQHLSNLAVPLLSTIGITESGKLWWVSMMNWALTFA